MSVSSTSRVAGPYVGDNVDVVYPFFFKAFQASDLYVVKTDLSLVETVQVLTTNYTVALNADQNASPGGSITMLVAPPTGFLITITTNLPALQSVALTNNGGFFPTVLNNEFDYLTILVQQLVAQMSRAVLVNISSNQTPAQLIGSLQGFVTAAAASASASAASASAASGSQGAAATSAGNAATSETNALGYMNNAATQAGNAANSANSAATSASLVGALTPRVTASNWAVAAGDLVLFSASGQTATLPATPAVGTRVAVSCNVVPSSTTISRNGNKIMGLAQDMTFTTPNVMVSLVYMDATNGWVIV